jgi:hypothetical protein
MVYLPPLVPSNPPPLSRNDKGTAADAVPFLFSLDYDTLSMVYVAGNKENDGFIQWAVV